MVSCFTDFSNVSTIDGATNFIRGGHSRESSSSTSAERQSWADMADEEDTVDKFPEGAVVGSGPAMICDAFSRGSLLHGTGQCKPCAFFHTKGCQSAARCLFCHLCPPREKQRRKKLQRNSNRITRDASKHTATGISIAQSLSTNFEQQSTSFGCGGIFQQTFGTDARHDQYSANASDELGQYSHSSSGAVPTWICQWIVGSGSDSNEWDDWVDGSLQLATQQVVPEMQLQSDFASTSGVWSGSSSSMDSTMQPFVYQSQSVFSRLCL